MTFIRIEKVLIFVFCSFFSYSQPTEWMNKLHLSERKINNNIPKEITKTKSVVFYSAPTKEEELKALHKKFLKTNIDVVNYVFLEDYLINNNVKKSFTDYFIKREIKNILFYNQKDKGNEELLLSSFNKKPTLINTKKNIWYNKGQMVFSNLEKTMLQNNFEEGNFLPTPQPERIEKIDAKFGKKTVRQTPSLEKETLGVVLFKKTIDSKKNTKEILEYNNKTNLQNKKLQEMFLNYNNKYEIIEEREDTRYYFTKGIKYMFTIIFSRKELIEKYLNIKIEQEFPKTPGYFVLLQHTFSKNVLLKKKPKMYLQWEDALQDFITNH